MRKTSLGVQDLRKRIATKAKADSSHRFWGLYCHVWKQDVLIEAYRLAKANKGAPGSDGKTFPDVEKEGLYTLIETLSTELKEGTYKPLPLRIVKIPKDDGRERTIKIAAIRDRVAQGALKLVLEPIFEMDFQSGSYGYRPKRTAHQALDRVRKGIGKWLFDTIDLDLKSYFDTVRHDLLLAKISKRVNDPDIMRLCKQILKSGGNIGLPQGSIVGPVFANLFLNDIDKMLERAQESTRKGNFEMVRYTRFADDIVVQVSASPDGRKSKLIDKVMHRLKEELEKLSLSINEDKTKVVRLDKGESFNFLGFSFSLRSNGKSDKDRLVISRPIREKRTEFLRSIRETLKKNRFRPVKEVIKDKLNPMIRGWVNYFRHGNSSRDLGFVKWQIEGKVRRFASRQTPVKRGGTSWTKWNREAIYRDWGLYSDYRVAYGS